MSVAHEDHYGPWTIEEVLALGEDRGQRRELFGDALIMSPNPATKHQWASSCPLSRLELVPATTLVVSELEAGRYVERLGAEAGRTSLIEKPFPVELDPGALVRQPGS